MKRIIELRRQKPHFYMADLKNYNEEFLIEIIEWQYQMLEAYKKQEASENDCELIEVKDCALCQKGKKDSYPSYLCLFHQKKLGMHHDKQEVMK